MSFLDAIFQAATSLKTTGDDVDVSAATPPEPGQLLVAVDETHAHWQDPATAGIDATARAAAATAQSTANAAGTAAATAQSTATAAGSAAATAQSTANAAGTAAATAQSTANAAVPKTLYDANTILIATTDDTPAPLTVGASTHVGRKASGDIVALTPTESKVILSLDSVTNDAQVKAAISGYTAKSPVVGADIAYIGDSAASYVIKKATLADIVALASLTGNPYIDVPSSPNAFDVEFLPGSNPDLAARGEGWVVKNGGATTLTRSGNINPLDATGPAGNTYWSTIVGSWLFLQAAPGVQIDLYKPITLAAGDTFSVRMGGSYSYATAAAGRYNEAGIYGLSATALDNNNRVYFTIRDDPTAANYLQMDLFRVTGGSLGSGGTRLPLNVPDVRAVRYDTGTNYYVSGINTGSNQVVSTLISGGPAVGVMAAFGIRNLFSTSAMSVPQIWAIDYVRRKTGNAWLVG